jgi:hypothetical protein
MTRNNDDENSSDDKKEYHIKVSEENSRPKNHHFVIQSSRWVSLFTLPVLLSFLRVRSCQPGGSAEGLLILQQREDYLPGQGILPNSLMLATVWNVHINRDSQAISENWTCNNTIYWLIKLRCAIPTA